MRTCKASMVFCGLLLCCRALAGTPADIKVSEAVTLAPKGGEGFQDRPDVAFGKDCYLVVWQDGPDGYDANPNILGARVSKDGKALDAEPIAVCKAPRDQRWPRVAWSPEAGVFLVVWEDQRNGTAYGIYAARVSPDGKVLDPDGFLLAHDKDRNQCQPDVCAAPGGGFVVAWMKYWTFPIYGVFGARVSADGKSLDGDGVALRTAEPQKTAPKGDAAPWVQNGHLFPRLAAGGGKVWLCSASPGYLGSTYPQCVELSTNGKLAVEGKPIGDFDAAIFGPRNYGFAVTPDGVTFATVTSVAGRGAGHEGIFFKTFPAQVKLNHYDPVVGQGKGRAIIDLSAVAAFDGKRYWVVYELGTAPGRDGKGGGCDIVAFRVDPKDSGKPLASDMSGTSGAIVIANAPTHEVHPEVAEGPGGQLLVVYVNDKDWDDRRVEARVVQAK